MKALSQDDRYKDVFNEDGTVNENASKERAIAIIDASSQGQSIQSKVNMKKNINFVETPVEGRTESFVPCIIRIEILFSGLQSLNN